MSTDAPDPSQVQWADTGAAGALSSAAVPGAPPDASQVQWDTAAPAPSALDTVNHWAGLANRALLKGTAELPTELAGVVQGAGEEVADKVGRIKAAVTGTPYQPPAAAAPSAESYSPKLSDFVHPEKWPEAAQYFADHALGTPQPATPAERVFSSAVSAAPSAVLAPEAPIAGTVSALVGGGASQAVAEEGGSPIEQTLAGLAAGSVGALGAGAAGASRLAIRGGSTGQAETAARVADAASSGTTLSAGQASGSRLLQAVEGTSTKLWGGGPLRQLADQQTKNIGSHVDSIVDNLSQGADVSPTAAGNAINTGVTATKQSMRTAEKAAYANVDTLVPPNTPVTVDGPIAEAHLTAQKQALENAVSSEVSGTGNASTPTGAGQTINVGVAAAKQAMRAAENDAYDKVDSLVPPQTPIPVSSTLAKLDALSQPTPGAEQTTAALVPKAITNLRSNIHADIRAASGTGTPAGTILGPDGNPLIPAGAAPPIDFSTATLPYSALADTRTKVGNSIDWGFAPADPVANAGLKQVYGALTDDLNNGAAAVSPEARTAAGNARSLYTANSDTRELLNSVVDKAGGPEAVYSAATSGLKSGATKLNGVMGALNPDAQSMVRSTILQRLGAQGGAFDSPTFLSNWSNLAPESKAAIVIDPTIRANFDAAASTHANLRAQLQAGTAQMPYSALVPQREALAAEATNAGLSPNLAAAKAHSALVSQMNAAAQAVSPEANVAVGNATELTAANQGRRDLLDSVVEKQGGPEAVFQAATNGTKQGATKIGQVMSAIGPDQQNIVRATVLDRLGRAVPSSQNAAGSAFSPGTFLTNWNKLAPEAKDALFGSNTSGPPGTLRSSLDSLANTTSTIRSSTLFKNPSGSGEAVAHAAGLYALLEGLGGGLGMAALGHEGATSALVGAATTAAASVSNNLMARVLTNPRTAQWLARSTKAPISSLPNAVNQLSQMGQRTQDQDASDLASYLSQPTPVARATGGRVTHEALVSKLITRWKSAKKLSHKTTEPLLHVPDAAITKALQIAQSHPS